VLEVTGVGAGEALVVALNLGDDELRVANPAPGGWLAGRDAGLDGDVLSVGPHGWAVVARA
jgi:cyclomaltodextrinase